MNKHFHSTVPSFLYVPQSERTKRMRWQRRQGSQETQDEWAGKLIPQGRSQSIIDPSELNIFTFSAQVVSSATVRGDERALSLSRRRGLADLSVMLASNFGVVSRRFGSNSNLKI